MTYHISNHTRYTIYAMKGPNTYIRAAARIIAALTLGDHFAVVYTRTPYMP